MFESENYEFDEEYAEPAHPAPPSPKAPVAAVAAPEPAGPVYAQQSAAPEQAGPVATAAPPHSAPEPMTAVAAPQTSAEYEPIVEEPAEEEAQEEYDYHQEFIDPAEDKPAPPKKKVNLALYAGFALLAVFTVFVLFATKPKDEGLPAGDLGPGVVAVSGLRGHLTTRWEGDAKTGKLMYQLRIEPMEDRWQAGFSRAASNPPSPLSLNVRLLDVTGFALCGKEIDFHFDPQTAGVPVAVPQTAGVPVAVPQTAAAANGKKPSQAERLAAAQAARQSQIIQMQAEEATRERGKDIFQNQTTDDGQVTALNAQGALPCSPDQYKRANYWDFNTNFPTLAEQAVLLDPKAAARARKEFEPPPHPDKRTLERLRQGFVFQGDDRVTGYDPVRGVLLAHERSFLVDKRLGRDTATLWANNYSLIHYRCDQRGNCSLTQAGGVLGLRARLNE
jgi:hypothetical protein